MTTTSTTPAPSKKHPCACSVTSISFGGDRRADLPKKFRDLADYDVDTDTTIVDTLCEEVTEKVFAPGHDAKFKGLMQVALRFGGDASIRDGGLLISTGPVELTMKVAPKLVDHVTRPVAAPKPRSAKAKAKAAKAAAAPVVIKAKVGRWEYEGTIDKTTGNFIYTDAKGKSKMTSAFTEV
jgi:hypothetical protein